MSRRSGAFWSIVVNWWLSTVESDSVQSGWRQCLIHLLQWEKVNELVHVFVSARNKQIKLKSDKNSKIAQCRICLPMMRPEDAFWGGGTTFGRLIWATFAALSPLHTSTHPLYQPDVHLRLIWTRLIVIEVFSSDSISLDRFILFVIRSHCARSSGGRRCWRCSFKWFTRKAVFVLNCGGKMQKWKKMQCQGVLWQVTKYTFACNICRLNS